jgi:PAS domain S-box-containing protein
MSKISKLNKTWVFLSAVVSGILVIGLFIYQLHLSYLQSLKQSELASFHNASFLLKEKMDSFIHGLQGMNGVYLATDFHPDLKTIRHYAESRNFFRNFPGAVGYGFVRRVPNNQLAQFVSQRKKQLKTFKIKRLATSHFSDSFIVEAIEPYETNSQALGLDIGSELIRRNTAEQAMDTGVPVISAPLQLVQKDQKGVGFLFFLPLYDQPQVPSTLSERRKKLIGWSNTPLHSSGLIEFLEKSIDKNLVLDISDEHAGLIHRDMRATDRRYSETSNWMRNVLIVGGRSWIVSGAMLPNHNLKFITFVALLFFFLFSCLYIFILFKIKKILIDKETSEIRVKEIESWQAAVLNGANHAMISASADGIISTFNKEAERITGYSADELIGKKTPEVFHDLDEVTLRAKFLSEELGRPVQIGYDTFIAKAFLNGTDTNEWTYISKLGKRIPVRLCVSALKNEAGNILGYLGVAEDLTEMKKIQTTLELQKQTMISSAKMAALGEMASGVAHEINNPLAIISGRTTVMKLMMEDGQLNHESLLTGLEKIEETTRRISKIIIGLRTFSRDSSNDPMVKSSLSSVIQDTLDLCHQRLINQNVVFSIHNNEDVHLLCRSVQVSQVLMNLLGNALDAIESLPTKWINLDVQKIGQKVFISVTDNGTIIAAETVDRMFMPFFTTKVVGKGTGLGLSISKGIIESHGGDLSYKLENNHNQFVIQLPCLEMNPSLE